jgi:solute:Na+ symporter, SSS family
MSTLDWVVMAAYGAVVLGIGWYANRRQKTSEDYFLGGRRLQWWVVGVSLVATSFSSLALIGCTGFGYRTGLKYLQLQIGDLLALIAVMVIFLPFFSSLRLTTAYEYLEKRFGVVARSVGSLLFIGQTLMRTAILVYAPALALAAILGWSIEGSILVAAGAAILYSAFGGIGAVVWTDLIQMAVVVFGVTVCVVLVAGDVPGGLGAILDHARESGRTEVVTLSASPGTPFNLLGSLIPYMFFAFSLFGTGQQAVQRFLSVRDLRSARRAGITAWTVGTIATAITLFLGVCIAAWADLAPTAGTFSPPVGDDVLPMFIAARLPAGLAGLMLAAIFAASMSSIDSAIHSMSTAGIVDFLRRFSKRPPSPKAELRAARLGTVAFGVIAVLGALYAAAGEAHIFETLFKWLAYFAGPLLGLFLLGLLTRRVEQVGALVGAGVAGGFVLLCVIIEAPRAFGFHPLWFAPGSCLLTFGYGYVVSLLRPPPPTDRIEGLTLFTRRP